MRELGTLGCGYAHLLLIRENVVLTASALVLASSFFEETKICHFYLVLYGLQCHADRHTPCSRARIPLISNRRKPAKYVKYHTENSLHRGGLNESP